MNNINNKETHTNPKNTANEISNNKTIGIDTSSITKQNTYINKLRSNSIATEETPEKTYNNQEETKKLMKIWKLPGIKERKMIIIGNNGKHNKAGKERNVKNLELKTIKDLLALKKECDLCLKGKEWSKRQGHKTISGFGNQLENFSEK